MSIFKCKICGGQTAVDSQNGIAFVIGFILLIIGIAIKSKQMKLIIDTKKTKFSLGLFCFYGVFYR